MLVIAASTPMYAYVRARICVDVFVVKSFDGCLAFRARECQFASIFN